MGGNALKTVKTRRYQTNEFEELKKDLVPKIKKIFSTEVYALKYYSDKESHGDMDLLLASPFSNQSNVKETLIKELGAKEIFHNSNVYSFDYEEFQIDLITIPKEEFDIAKVFYDYNDLGNLVGKLANSLGLKFGPNGLRYIITDEKRTKRYEDLVLTTDVKKIFNSLDLSYSNYSKGFNSLDEIFEWIKDSKYFNKNVASLSSMRSDQRHRDKKRKNVMKFQDWASEKGFTERPKFSREETIKFIDDNFPKINIYSIIDKYSSEEKDQKEISKKFNGDIIKKEFNIEGAILGKAIIKFKNSLGDNFKSYILSHTQEEILKKFKETIDL